MNSDEIFRALQAGELSSEDAERELSKVLVDKQKQASSLPSLELSGKAPVVDLQEIEPCIVQLTMQDRINKNTFSQDLIRGLIHSFELIQSNPGYKAVILTGYESYFAAGGTRESLLSIYEGKTKFTDSNLHSLALDCKIPVIAAMQGHGIGAGWSMGMFCDFVVMSRESFYASNYMSYGFTPGAGATLIFPEKFGISLAQEILFTGRNFRGAELEAKGVPFPVLPRREVLPYAIQLACKLAESPRESLIALKDNMTEAIKSRLADKIDKELKMHAITFVNQPEVKERIQSLYNQSVNQGEPVGLKPDTKIPTGDSAPAKAAGAELPPPDSIAVIGMSGQFPRAKNLAEFWDNLVQGRDCISEIPAARWSIDEYYDPDPKVPGKTCSKWMGALEDADKFDPLFFNISPAEAELMDPQQRLFLENCWHCFEDAGLSFASLSGSRCGVFVGCGAGDYGQFIDQEQLSLQSFMGEAISILSARISYLLNLKGPCLAIDTACSSSLVAVAEACNSLILQTSDLALAGGVYVAAGPAMHIKTSKSGMLSPDGKCFTFDNRANGFVPGEGVGVILLKRFSEAVRDQDPIYGVIRGWGINQDGKTNGMTAPSANSQVLLEQEVYRNFGINPATISLAEAHGTGTKLGDPIEVEALIAAFRSFTDKKNYCALGSVKSNIGHLLTAAGISGVIKILLALRHRMLPPTINFAALNEHIFLENSPFYINTQLQPWEVSPGIPRRACVSSFGFSGTNAHIVIEEYQPGPDAAITPILTGADNPILFVLSAKRPEQLIAYAECMRNWIESQEDLNLADMAYTLQVGREAMNNRLAFPADSREALLKALTGFIDNKPAAGVLTGQAPKSQAGVMALADDEDAAFLLQTWLQKKKLNKVAELWVKGLNPDWNQLYGNRKPRRISLPAYPFAKERYWLPPRDNIRARKEMNRLSPVIHPLLQQNTSDLFVQRFSSTFTGQEFFLADHIIKSQRILPGVAYLEIARAAVEMAGGALKEGRPGIRLKNVVWTRPIVVLDQPVETHISLYPKDSGEIDYEIYSEPPTAGAAPVIHSRGRAVLSTAEEVLQIPDLDIKALQAECSQNTFSAAQFYEAFRAIGVNLGPGLQGIDRIYVGAGRVLTKLSLPAAVAGLKDQYVLHPSLIDGAVQSPLGLSMGRHSSPMLPFALQELEILGDFTATMWSLLRYSDDNTAGDKVHKFDIDLCDQQGKICVRLKGLSYKVLEREESSLALAATEGVLMVQPCWQEQGTIQGATVPDYYQHLVILCEADKNTQDSIESRLNEVRCLTLQSNPEDIADIAEGFQTCATQVFNEIQSIIKSKPMGKVLLQIVVSTRSERQLWRGLAGLLKTAQLENPKLIGQLIEVEPGEDPAGIIEKIKENSKSPHNNHIRYQNGKRWVSGWGQVENYRQGTGIPWRDQGIYLLTGGAGGLGLIFAGEIAAKAKNVTLILTGRSPLNKNKQAQLAKLRDLGARIEYRQVDVTDKKAVAGLIQSIQGDYGSLNGIVHGAGIIRDNFILRKSEAELQEVLAPKVTGLVNLDQASKDLSLDFFILFSSIAASLGNPGQADYATANSFMDAYAGYRNELVAAKQRQGQTLSINWPLWQEGGMHVDGETEKLMQQNFGIIPLRTSTGINALYQSLAAGSNQIMVVAGNPARIKQKLLVQTAVAAPEPNQSPAAATLTGTAAAGLPDKVQLALRQIVSKLLKVKPNSIEADTKLSEYGFDSITFTEFANELNKEYRLELAPTIFFEHSTLHDFTSYLLAEHQAAVAVRHTISAGLEIPIPRQAMEEGTGVNLSAERRQPRLARLPAAFLPKPDAAMPEPIAIVGMSGIFPQARDLDEFWRNLAEGKDCITEIPPGRWDWRQYYGDPRKETNKTNIKWGAFIDEADKFDPLFFGISPKEAQFMDPQQRLLMTYVWKAVEDAGYSPQSLSGTNTGIFAGTIYSGYSGLICQANAAIEGYFNPGMVPSVGPNRMSYFLNIHGPSEPIETACSSALVAIHRAVNAIENGNCEMAIAGGVNILVSPESYISFNKAGMLCEDGKCKPFSNQADGYVRGEGAGMILLKKLQAAEKAGDHIYGVIRGSAENHGGRANSLTAPNPKAQAAVLKAAYAKAGIDPRTVSYIEAHGTGTELGDPIEINALKSAFKDLYQAAGNSRVAGSHCGVGSVKSNIGHLEVAAGIAGVIKVLLQLKHKTLARSLHCSTLNPYIQLQDSPFYIVQETKEWKALQDSYGQDMPRRAGVSSFGFGGVNAHVVIEEYVSRQQERPQIAVTVQEPAIIILSAKNEERLYAQAQQLLTAVKERQLSDAGLADVAYTLQVGREAMEERLGLMAGSGQELEEKLQAYLNGQDDIPDLYRGQIKGSKEDVGAVAAGADTAATIDAWITKRDYAKLLERWTDGWNLDWNRLYGDIKPRRISLPTYPFARERYWIPASNNQTDQTNQTNREETAGVSWPRNVQSDNSLNCRQPDRPAYLHPLLHQNTSDLSKQRFSTIFTGQEFFLADHIVKEQRVLPGAAYLEMARTAVAYSAGVRQEKSIQLKNVVWTRPIIVAEPVQVHVELFAEPNGEIVYEIYSRPEKSDSEPVLHSQGRAGLSSVDAGPNLDIESLQSKCNQAIFSAGQCYEAFRAVGIDYGPSHQGVEKIWAGPGQVLAKLSLPAAVADTKEQFILHPSLLDSALQASIGLMPGSGNAIPSGGEARPQPFLPFALQKIEIVGKCTAGMWALLRYSHGSQAGGNVAKIDIDLYDDQGNIKVRLKGLSLRVLAGEREVSSPPAAIPGVQVIEKDLLRQKAINYLKKQFSAVIKLPEQKIAADASLEKYGVDSIMAMELTNQLENIFGPLSKTLLFEYQNIQALAEYFLATYRGKLLEVLGMAATTAASADASQDTGLTPAAVPVSERRERPRFASIQIEVPARKATDAWDIAIIGLAGRYPGGATIQEFWGNLQAGRDCITEIPQERWNHRLFFDENKNTPEKTYCKWGGFLEEVDQFDPLFFNISPREAEIMEPMDRLFLETVWNLLESTGYTREALQRQYEAKVGVYVGAMYQQYHAFDSDMVKEAAISLSSYSSIANRVSHYFNFQGPSIAIDTMCSSSTIAIHMACESLMRRESRIAIAGGVNLSIHPKKYIGLSQRQMIGSHVNSRSFGDGDGYLPAECVGAVLLKPLLEAIQDGDTILAVIKSTATNHGGHTSGITVPNPNAQAKLIEDNFIKSGIDPRTISYVEAAANGSALGDAIEITALNKAFQKFTTDQQFCPIGSVKSNIGHAEAASGITQLTKVILQLQHRRLVPSIKAEPPNPNIDFNNTPFYLQRELQEWQRPLVKINGAEREFPRRATVSSFGAGGSNAHVIIEEYVPPQEEPVPIQNTPAMKPQLIVFSARNPERLQAVIEKMLHFIEVQKDISLPDLAYTLQLGREAMEYRVAMMANSRQELVRGMREYLAAIKAGQELPASGPVFSGNTEEDHSEIRSLLSGIAGETLLQVFLVEKDFNKLALYWVKGGKIPWESLHAGEKVRRISLPTYPFEKRRCWLEPHKPPSPGQQFTFASPAAAEVIPSQEVHKVINENEEPASMPNAAGTQYIGIDNLDNQVANIIANLLGMTAAELNLNKPLDQYGLDSIQFISLFQRLQSQIDLSLTVDKLRETKTAQDIIAVLRPEKGDKPAAPGQQAVVSVLAASEFIPKDWSKFPELIHLNENFKGRPVFWIHGAIGGVETYQGIARKIQRPFYGIQARGWMTDRVPLNGIQATAAYYVNIIRSVQPSGPYDLGGYSLGGAIAYEITRQLQEMGEAVATLVMLDAFDGSGLSKFSFSDRDILLQTVNIALMNTILQEPEKFAQTFIHRDELILTGDDKEELVKQVVKLAQKRGLKKTETQLYAMSQKDLAIRRAYEMGSFSVWPLPDAQTVKCYYFRNRNGLFYGALEPYLSAAETSLNSLTHTNYWKEWEREMPHFYMMDVDASNHMVLLSEPQSYEPIMALCEKLYSETGMTPEFFEPFFQKHKS